MARRGGLVRLPMLARLAARYARRHRAQTVRAVLGLLVVSLILTVGMGLGDSLQASLGQSVETRFGPVDVVVRGPPQFNATLLPELEQVAGVQGVPTLVVVGSASNPRSARAEAFASLRGVDSKEPALLGPLPGGVAEPGPGEVVLSAGLATRLDAQPGDLLTLRLLPQDLNETLGIQATTAAGNLTAGGRVEVPFTVGAGALGVLANADGAGLEAALRSPTGQIHPAEQGEVRVLGQVAAGGWNLTLTASAATSYEAVVRVGYTPPDLEALVVVLNATVAGIAPTEGRAAITPRPGALLPLADLEAALGQTGLASHAYFTAPGPGEAVRAAEALRAHLDNRTWRADAVKEDAVTRIRTEAGQVTGFILVMGGFTMVASMLLAYVLFSSLVEERRVELGIARALGLTRGEVGLAMLLEALLYSVLAAVAGVVAGLGLLLALQPVANGYSAQFNGPPLFLHLEPNTVPLALAGGVLLPLATIALGTLRFTRLDPSRAIRGSPEDVRVHRRLADVAGWLLLAFGLALLLDPLGRLVGMGVAAAGAATLLLAARRRGWAAVAALAGIAATAWTLYTFEEFPRLRRDLDPVFTMLRALMLALLLATLAVCSPRPFGAAGRLFARVAGLRRAAYAAFRYLGARRVQAGLTAAMVAVVAVVVTVMGTLAAVFAGTLVTQEAGYDLIGQSPFPLTTFPRPLDPADAAGIARADFVAVHNPFGGARVLFEGEPFREGRFVRFGGVTPGFAGANEYQLSDRDARYPSDRAAWEAVARGEAALPPSWYFGNGELEVGGTLQVGAGAGERSYVVAGAIANARRGEIFLAHDHVRGMGFPQSAIVFVRVAPGTDPARLAHSLTDAYQADGLAFESVAEEAQEAADLLQASILIVQAFLFLGVFVGIASTGFLAARAVHERMREIGTLRALGYEETDVRRAFVLESTVVAALGLLLGTAVGLLVAHSIWWRTVRQGAGPFNVPWDVLAVFWAAVLLLTALASWSPTRRAARLDPAAALRHVE
ncbi:MAG: putative transport system permease protein [Thermoplasmata archaeon]|jgi:putative ABC transport system permease protein|nr:putative transport system permease protein [Thermoplasmata archaeon]